MRDVRLLVNRSLAIAHEVAESALALAARHDGSPQEPTRLADLGVAPLARVACICSAILGGNADALRNVPGHVAAAMADTRPLREAASALRLPTIEGVAVGRLQERTASLEAALQRLSALIGCAATPSGGAQRPSSRNMMP